MDHSVDEFSRCSAEVETPSVFVLFVSFCEIQIPFPWLFLGQSFVQIQNRQANSAVSVIQRIQLCVLARFAGAEEFFQGAWVIGKLLFQPTQAHSE